MGSYKNIEYYKYYRYCLFKICYYAEITIIA